MAPVASSSTSAGPSSRKRKTPAADVAPTASSSRSQPLETLTGSLELGADSDEEDLDGDVALEGAAAEDDDDEEEFPELDIGSSDEDEEESAPAPSAPRSRRARRKAPSPVPAPRRGDEADDEEDDRLEEDDGAIFTEEDSGSQSGYNSSDIDDDEAAGGSPFGSPSTAATSLAGRSVRSASPVTRFLAEHTVKPDERDHALPDKQIDPQAGVMTISDLTGRPKRVYRDIEAGYGSESSTEDVSTDGSLESHVRFEC